MERSIFDKARKWICFNARPIERARFRYLFENGSREAVLAALAEYQNEDGGFGHALEADCFNPTSSPIQTWAATEILNEIGLSEGHPIIRGILAYLDSGKDFNGKFWLNTVPTNNDYPHAPWWTYNSKNHDAINYNPTAALASFALRFADKNSSLYQKCYAITKEAIQYLQNTDNGAEMHLLACYVRLTEYCHQAGLTEELQIVAVEKLLVEKVKKALTWDRDLWKTNYVCKPSNFFTNKESFLYQHFAELAQYECEFIRNTQLPDGTWTVNWQWGGYPEEWCLAKNWWKAHLIIMNLKFLQEINGELPVKKPPIRKLYCINLHTAQIEKMKSFYHDLLEIPITFPGYNNELDGIKFGFDADSLQICLWKEEYWGKGKGPVEIAIRGNLEAIVQRLEEKQYQNFKLLHESYGDCLIIHDPDGNQLTIM